MSLNARAKLALAILLFAAGCGSTPTRAGGPSSHATASTSSIGEAQPPNVGAGPDAGAEPERPLPPPPYHRAHGNCAIRVPVADEASPPVAASQAQLEQLTGCDPAITVDWEGEKIALVALEGTNQRFLLEDVTIEQGVATITIRITSYVAGAALYEQMLWLVRVPAAATEVRLDRKRVSEPWVGPEPP